MNKYIAIIQGTCYNQDMGKNKENKMYTVRIVYHDGKANRVTKYQSGRVLDELLVEVDKDMKSVRAFGFRTTGSIETENGVIIKTIVME